MNEMPQTNGFYVSIKTRNYIAHDQKNMVYSLMACVLCLKFGHVMFCYENG